MEDVKKKAEEAADKKLAEELQLAKSEEEAEQIRYRWYEFFCYFKDLYSGNNPTPLPQKEKRVWKLSDIDC